MREIVVFSGSAHPELAHRICDGLGVRLSDLPVDSFRKASDAFPPSVREVFDFERSVEARDLPGGTSRRSILSQIATVRAAL